MGRYYSNFQIYIPIWFYSISWESLEKLHTYKIYIPIWFYSISVTTWIALPTDSFTFQSGSILSPILILLYFQVASFTFQSGSILSDQYQVVKQQPIKNLHSNLVLFYRRLNNGRSYSLWIYIPIWFYSIGYCQLKNNTSAFIYIPIWFYSIMMMMIFSPQHSTFTFQSGSILSMKLTSIREHLRKIYIPIWFYSICRYDGRLYSGYNLHSNLVLFYQAEKEIEISSIDIYIPIWFYSIMMMMIFSPQHSTFTFQSGSILSFSRQLPCLSNLAFTFQSGSILSAYCCL